MTDAVLEEVVTGLGQLFMLVDSEGFREMARKNPAMVQRLKGDTRTLQQVAWAIVDGKKKDFLH